MLSLILMTFSHFNAADLEFPEPFFPGPQQNMQNCNWEEQQPANSTDRDFSRSIGPLALLGNYVRYPSLYNGEEALGFASEDCVNKAISSYLAVAEELSHGRSMNRNHEPGDENVALKVYLTTYDSTYYDAVFMQRDCTNELFSLYVSIVEPKSSLHRILSATVGKRGEKMLSPDALYSSMQDEAYALTIYRSYSILADLGRFESSVCEGNSEAIWSFLGKHLDTYAIERLQSGRMRPPRPLDDIKVRISTAECLEYLGGPAQLELVKQLQQNLPAFDEGPIAPKYVPLLRAELDSRVDYLGQLLKTPAMERVAIDNDAFPSPYFPEPKSAATRVLDEFTAARDPAAATESMQSVINLVSASLAYVPATYKLHGQHVLRWSDSEIRQIVAQAYPVAVAEKSRLEKTVFPPTIWHDFQNVAASTFEPSLYDVLLHPMNDLWFHAYAPTGVSVRLLYLAKVNPETTLDALLRCGKQADEKSDYIYDTRTAQRADGRGAARTERRYIATWKEAFEILSYMADVSPEALRARADEVRRFVADYAFLYADRSTRMGKGESYSPWNDFHMRNFALDVMAVVGTKDDADLIHRLGNEIRDVDFIEFYQDIVDRQHAHLAEKAAGLLEKTGE